MAVARSSSAPAQAQHVKLCDECGWVATAAFEFWTSRSPVERCRAVTNVWNATGNPKEQLFELVYLPDRLGWEEELEQLDTEWECCSFHCARSVAHALNQRCSIAANILQKQFEDSARHAKQSAMREAARACEEVQDMKKAVVQIQLGHQLSRWRANKKRVRQPGPQTGPKPAETFTTTRRAIPTELSSSSEESGGSAEWSEEEEWVSAEEGGESESPDRPEIQVPVQEIDVSTNIVIERPLAVPHSSTASISKSLLRVIVPPVPPEGRPCPAAHHCVLSRKSQDGFEALVMIMQVLEPQDHPGTESWRVMVTKDQTDVIWCKGSEAIAQFEKDFLAHTGHDWAAIVSAPDSARAIPSLWQVKAIGQPQPAAMKDSAGDSLQVEGDHCSG